MKGVCLQSKRDFHPSSDKLFSDQVKNTRKCSQKNDELIQNGLEVMKIDDPFYMVCVDWSIPTMELVSALSSGTWRLGVLLV